MPNNSNDLASLLSKGWVSLNKFSKLIGVSYPTAQRMYKRGDIQAHRVGGVIRVYTGEMRRFLKEGNAPQEETEEEIPLSFTSTEQSGDDND